MKRERLLSKVLILALIGTGATLAGVGLDAFLAQQGMSDSSILCLSNVLSGIVIGAMAVQYRLLLKTRHRILEERIATLSEMHQHLRSVITSLAFYGTQMAHADVLSEHLRRVEAHLADLFTRLLFDRSVPQSVLKAVRNTGIIRALTKSTSGANL